MVFVSIMLFVVSGALMLIRPSTGLNQLAYYDQTGAEAADMGANQERVLSGVVAAVDYVAGKRGFKRLAYEELDRAGLPLRPAEYITLHIFIVVVTGIAAGMASQSIAVSLLVVIFATVAPIVWIGMRIRKRREAFEAQLPDTLDLIAGSLRAGWGLQQAIEAVVEQAKPPISEEFRRAQTEVRLGRLSEQALESVAARMQSVDFNWVVSAISIQREVGGNLAELLNIVSSTIRERNALKRQVATLTSEGRLSAVILFVLPFLEAAVLFVINRGYISQLFVTSTGLVMLITGILLLVIGGVWLNRVIRVEV
jgi:tight adherence protein B